MPHILFTAPTADIAQKAERIIQRRRLDIPVITADDQSAHNAVLAFPESFVVISRGGVAEEIKKISGRTVIEVTTSAGDILTALTALNAQGLRRIAVVMRGNILFDTPQNFSLAGMDILIRPCDTYEEIAETVHRLAAAEEIDGIAGCRYAAHIAEEVHLPNVYVEVSERSIEKAVDDALKVIDAKRRESLQRERLDTVIQKHAKVHFSDILTKSLRMQEIIACAKSFAQTCANVLILGETGTGKEWMAQSIHNASPRVEKPFIAVNCASIPPSLIESELFGWGKGIFSGTPRAEKKGLFELADGGTIFLDEVAELAPDIQGRLLNVLQKHEIMRGGDARPIQLDIRMICATNKDLDQLVTEGKFREDLYYRINVLRLQLPPLRERHEDILPLLRHYITRYAPQADFDQLMQKSLRDRLLSYSWPGNIRELRNTAEVLSCLDNADLDPVQTGALLAARPADRSSLLELPLGLPLKEVERIIIERTLEHYTPEETCEKLGISRVTLWRRLREKSDSI